MVATNAVPLCALLFVASPVAIVGDTCEGFRENGPVLIAPSKSGFFHNVMVENDISLLQTSSKFELAQMSMEQASRHYHYYSKERKGLQVQPEAGRVPAATAGATRDPAAPRSQPGGAKPLTLLQKLHINLRARSFQDPEIWQLFEENRNISAIVVGANDGAIDPQSNDPLIALARYPNVRALMVEPNPTVFKILEKNLKQFPESARLHALNIAICADKKGMVPFYTLSSSFEKKCPDAPHWAKYELSSMDYHTISKHWHNVSSCGFKQEKEFESFIEEIQVPCWTPSDLMGTKDFEPQQIDLLMVDAEGLDHKIVMAFFSQKKFDPTVLIYEEKHLAPIDRDKVHALLKRRGYKTSMDLMEGNVIAWK